jgi:hypothetical protein
VIKKIFLKYNKDPRENPSSLHCLNFWLTVFADRDVYIICDIFDPTLKFPKQFTDYSSCKFINSNYALSEPINHLLVSKRWRNVAASNLSCYEKSESEPFWLIDADDTLFITFDVSLIKEKIKLAEHYFLENKLDGFSLDFYRTFKRDHWSFGVALLQDKHDLINILCSTDLEFFQTLKLPFNLDALFDCNRRQKKLKLESFVFDNTFFQHQLEQKFLPYGIYKWENKKLWDMKLNPDVKIF